MNGFWNREREIEKRGKILLDFGREKTGKKNKEKKRGNGGEECKSENRNRETEVKREEEKRQRVKSKYFCMYDISFLGEI